MRSTFLPLVSGPRHRRSPVVRRLVVVAVAALVTTGLLAALAAGKSTTAQATASDAWGGYSNGNIPASALTAIPGGQLRTDAAAAYVSMAAAFKAHFHETLTVTQGYRSLADQKSIFLSRYTVSKTPTSISWNKQYWTQKPNTSVAAVPGTSIHGWALAIDFGAHVYDAKSPEKAWANANGPKYGWYPKGDSFGEPWHFEFTPVTKTAAATKPAATVTPKPVVTKAPTVAPKPMPTVAPAPKNADPAAVQMSRIPVS